MKRFIPDHLTPFELDSDDYQPPDSMEEKGDTGVQVIRST